VFLPHRHSARRFAPASLSASFLFAVIASGFSPAPARAEPAAAPARAPFTPASTASGATLFTPLSPAATGITVRNPYDDPRMWGARYREFMGGGLGSGVAAGDFDGDGNVDLYVSTKTKPGRLYRNLGGWKFADVTEAAGLAGENSILGWLKSAVSSDTGVVWRQGAVFADVDNDGRLDLYVCRNDAPNLLYMNRGDGTFAEEGEQRGLAVVDGSVVGAFADYDRDGWLDVFIVTNQVDGTEPGGRPDRLFHNDGHGRFTEVTARAGIAGPTFGHSATWIDYDEDGWSDLHVACDFSGPDRLYHNRRDGTFTNVLDAVVPHTPFSSMGADLADINHDGHFDLLVADMATTTREKNRRGLAASKDDVVAMATAAGAAPQYLRNALLLNTGLGVFGEVACWAGVDATDWTWSVRFEDFDNDGWADLHVTNGMVREPNNSDLLDRMMRALSDQQRISVIKNSPPLAESNLAYRNVHGAGFEPVTDAWGLGEIGVSFGAATADFDRDGDLDLVYLNYDGGVSVFRNDVTGRHRVQVRLQGARSNRQGVGAVIRVESAACGRQSQTLTVARGYAAGSELVAHFGLGADEKIDRLVVEWPSGARQTFTDLAADFAYTIVESPSPAPAAPAAVSPLFRAEAAPFGLNLDDASRPAIPEKEQAFIPFRTDRRGPGIAVTDIDGDEHDDILLSATTGSPSRLLRWKDGRYSATPLAGVAASAVEDGPPFFFDADGNGTRDLLLTRASANARAWPGAYRAVLSTNDGRGNFKPTDWLPEISLNVGAVCAADFDGDGDLDLFLGGRSVPGHYPEAPRSFLLRNDGGRFVDITRQSPQLSNAGLVKSAVFRDLDRDGRPDLLVALEWDYVRYFHNEGESRFSDATEKAGFTSGGRGWWNGIAAADFNGDGRLDFAVGNLGLNTPYTASPRHPATLFYGDFAGNGTRLISEAVYDGDALYPLRGRADLGARLPFVLKKFPKNDAFARAKLEDVLGRSALDAAETFQADNFSSGVFLSQPDGTYRFEPLPREAQTAPMQGIAAVDFDGDGRADLAVLQNTDSAIPRFHGGFGLFLSGRGDGTFTALSPAESGILVPGNGRALAVIDANDDAQPDLFFTQQGGKSELLVNASSAARQWLKLRLAGAPGNPDAIGAKVHLAYADGSAAEYEVGFDGGWLTQSRPDLFVALSPGRRLTEVRVAWPDGRHSRHADIPSRGLWTLRVPGAR
jgi:hypothetical protein